MGGAALALVLGSAALHAAWNVLVAGAPDNRHAVTAVGLLAGAVGVAPLAALKWDLEAAALPFVAASAALEVAYLALLATAYAHAGLSVVYPVARGSAPVLVLAVSVAMLAAPVDRVQALGVLGIALGATLVRGFRRPTGGAFPLALGVGACIAASTLVDDRGLAHAGSLAYFELVLWLGALPYALAVALREGGSALRAAVSGRAVPVGLTMTAAYALILAALEHAEAAPVAALRETSVVMATAAGAMWGRERVSPGRAAGALIVVGGVAAIALG